MLVMNCPRTMHRPNMMYMTLLPNIVIRIPAKKGRRILGKEYTE